MSDFDINNLFGVKGMVVVITGGGSGIGLNVAKAYVHLPIHIYLLKLTSKDSTQMEQKPSTSSVAAKRPSTKQPKKPKAGPSSRSRAM